MLRISLLSLFIAFSALQESSHAIETELDLGNKIYFAATSTEVGFLGKRLKPLSQIIRERAEFLCRYNELTFHSFKTETKLPDGPQDMESYSLTGDLIDLEELKIVETQAPYSRHWQAFDAEEYSNLELSVDMSKCAAGLFFTCVAGFELYKNTMTRKNDESFLWGSSRNQLLIYGMDWMSSFARDSMRSALKKLNRKELSEEDIRGLESHQIKKLEFETEPVVPHILFKQINCSI